MKRMLANGVAAAAIAAVVPVVVGSAPASAACASQTAAFAVNPANSALLNANTNCNGLTADFTWNIREKFLGQYYTGVWNDSTLGWKYVTTSGGAENNVKLVGDTVDGRLIRGVAQTTKENVYVTF